MRRMLAGFLATSMIVAVASATTFAATTSAYIETGALIIPAVQPNPAIQPAAAGGEFGLGTTAGDTAAWQADVHVDNVEIDILDSSNRSLGSFIVNVGNKVATATGTVDTDADADNTNDNAAFNVLSGWTNSDVAKAIAGSQFSDVNIGGVYYSGQLVDAGSGKVGVKFTNASIANMDHATVNIKLSFDNVSTTAVYTTAATVGTPALGDKVPVGSVAPVSINNSVAAPTKGTAGETADVDKAGSFDKTNVGIRDVVVSYSDGSPIPMTENKVGVDEDLNDQGGVQSGKTLYFMLRDDDNAFVDRLEDDNYWKIKVSKGENGKYIKEIEDVTKIIGSGGMYNATDGSKITGIDFTKRHRFIKVKLNEIFTDDEYKITLDMRISAKSAAADKLGVDEDSEIKVKDFSFWMKNLVKEADNDWKVGIGGLMLNPLENDWNEVTYFDEDGDLAFMKFFADSDVDKFYAKLSTKWEHADYASYFNDQDAFIFNFTGSPKLSSTSRADLQIYNPFVDEDGNETVDPTTAVVYQVIDGDLYDVTDSFEYKEGDNGDMAFCTRTRFLGTYIICEKAVEEAVADETVPDELTPDTTEAPEDLTPDNNAGGKQPANTGRYI